MTTARTCSILAVFSFLALLPAQLSADTASASSDWVLASREYEFGGASSLPTGAEQIVKLLPQLILEQISTGSTRELPAGEVLSRRLDTLQTERLSLFLQLSKEYKTRDALVVNVMQSRKLEKQLAAEQKKIREIENQIDENLAQVDKEIQSRAEAIRQEEAVQNGGTLEEDKREDRRFPFPFQLPFPFFRDGTEEPVSERITLYKNDVGELFSPSESALSDGPDSWAYQKEVASAKINGLLTGRIIAFGEYISVTVELTLYPGAKSVAVVTEVGLTSDLLSLSERIVRALVPRLTNALPVIMHIHVFPEPASQSAMLTLDGIVFPHVPAELALDAAVHTISVSAPGYETASVTYHFEGQRQYDMQVSLVPEVSGSLRLRLKKLRDGLFYANGIDSAAVTEEEPKAEITINGKSVLGIFTTGSGESESSAFFYIPARLAREDASLVVNAKPYDRAANIDKRRRRMYTAYSALICSLPVTFYCVGNFTSANDGYSLGRATYDDAVEWQKRANISLGVTALCGVWTVWELYRYLRAANEVLPAAATRNKKD